MQIFDIFKNNENEVLLRAASGDSLAFSQVYDAYADAIFRFIFFKVSNKEDAEDLTARVFLKVWDFVRRKEASGAQFKALLYTVARNLVIDYYRAKRTDIAIEEAENIQSQYDLEHIVAVKNDFEQATETLKCIKIEYREVIMMRFIEELSISEIAEILNKKEVAVRVLIHRAIKSAKNAVKVKNNEQ